VIANNFNMIATLYFEASAVNRGRDTVHDVRERGNGYSGKPAFLNPSASLA
jgi:hypothetical protein